MKPKKKNSVVTKSGKSKEESQDKNTPSKIGTRKKHLNEEVLPLSILKEQPPSYSIASRIRAIGNSKGVILPNRIIEETGIAPDADILIQVSDGDTPTT